MNVFKNLLVLGLATLLLTSCSTFFGQDGRRGVSSSLVDYLYPDGQVPTDHEEIQTQLQLPLRVGLAFVPQRFGGTTVLVEAKKMQLLEEVKGQFDELEYIEEIVIVPETYMRSSKGFDGVQQIARLYSLDVVALVSYDQVATTAQTKSSLLYWTIVGAYFIEGNQNTAATFVDTAVFDVASSKLLFRAPGVSETEQRSTLIETRQSVAATRAQGFELAMTDMSNNLALELEQFEEKIKQDKSVKITRQAGYGGGGSISWQILLGIVSISLCQMSRSRWRAKANG